MYQHKVTQNLLVLIEKKLCKLSLMTEKRPKILNAKFWNSLFSEKYLQIFLGHRATSAEQLWGSQWLSTFSLSWHIYPIMFTFDLLIRSGFFLRAVP